MNRILNFKFLILNYGRGQFLIELLLAIGLAAIILPALLTGLVASRAGKAQQQERLDATALLKEQQEALRIFRETSWANLSALTADGTTHYSLKAQGTTWVIQTGDETVTNNTTAYTRYFTISDVKREPTAGAIAPTPTGTLSDPSTKAITSTVSWTSPFPTSVQSITYLTRKDNGRHIETLSTDFTGTKTGTTTRQTTGDPANDYEIILGAGNTKDWCSPTESQQGQITLSSGQPNALFAIPGQVFAGTGDNASGVSFASYNITDPRNIPPPTGTFNGYKTNDIFVDSAGNYAYLATDNVNKPVVIIDLHQKDGTGKYLEVGYFKLASGNGQGSAVTVSGNMGFVAINTNVYGFSVSPLVGGGRPQLQVGPTFGLPGAGMRMKVVNNKIFVAVQGTTKLKVINITNPAQMGNYGQVSIGGVSNYTQDVAVSPDGNTAYIVTSHSASWDVNNVFVIDTSTGGDFHNPISYYTPDHAFNTQDPTHAGIDEAHAISLQVVGSTHYVLVGGEGTTGNQYQVYKVVLNPFSVTYCNGLPVPVGVFGVTSLIDASGNAFSYVMTKPDVNNGTGLRIFAGGAGGTYATSGTYISTPFLASATAVSFNHFEIKYTRPTDTDLQLQIATADTVGGVCPASSSMTFYGPGGTSAASDTFHPAVAPTASYADFSIPLNLIPKSCVAYKAILTSSSNQTLTPTIQYVDVNYSP